MSSQLLTVAVSFATNAIIALVFWVAFLVLRPKVPHVYCPRVALADNAPPLVPQGVFAWIGHSWRLTDQQIFDTAGLDALMLIKFLSWALRTFCLCSAYGLVVLITANNYGGEGLHGLDILTMANVKSNSNLLWLHLFSAYLFTGIALSSLNRIWRKYVDFRQQYFALQMDKHYAVLVRDLPKGTTSDSLTDLYRTRYPDTLVAHVGKSIPDLIKACAKRKKTAATLDHVTAVIDEARAPQSKGEKYRPIVNSDSPDADAEEERPTKRVGGFLCCGGEVRDAQEEYVRELDDFNLEVAKLQTEADSEPAWMSGGIVVFRTKRSAELMAEASAFARDNGHRILAAPEERDMIWGNLNVGFWSRVLRTTLVTAFVFWLVLFWLIPITAVSALTTLDKLEKLLPFVKDLPEALLAFLQGFLPTLALLIFMALLPMILSALSKVEGRVSKSSVQQGLLSKFYLFQIINVFFAAVLGSAMLSDYKKVARDPLSAFSILADRVPPFGTFFLNYTMLQSMAGFPLLMLRLGPLIVSWIKKKYLCKTAQEVKDAEAPGDLNYGVVIPMQMLILCVGLLYSTVTPFILPFSVLYFALATLCFRYQVVYVYMATFESGGALWPSIFARIIVSLCLYLVTLTGILTSKTVLMAPMLVPALVAVICFYVYAGRHYKTGAAYASEQPQLDVGKRIIYLQPELTAEEIIPNVEVDASSV